GGRLARGRRGGRHRDGRGRGSCRADGDRRPRGVGRRASAAAPRRGTAPARARGGGRLPGARSLRRTRAHLAGRHRRGSRRRRAREPARNGGRRCRRRGIRGAPRADGSAASRRARRGGDRGARREPGCGGAVVSRRPTRARIARAILAEAPGASLLVVLLAALLAGGAAAASGWASHARSEVLRSAIADAPPAQRDLGDTARGVPTTGLGHLDHDLAPEVAAAWGVTFDSLDAIAAEAEPAAAAVLGEPHAALQLDQAPAVPTESGVSAPDTSILLRADPILERLVDLVDGELPGPIVEGEPIPIALTPAIADAFGWPLGQVRSA